MVLYNFTINDVEYGIHIMTKKRAYYCLCRALLEEISDEQQKRITITTRDKRNIILYRDLIGCFDGVRNCSGNASCICGQKDITDLYMIKNKEYDTELIVGSTCSNNWFEMKKIKGCQYCDRVNQTDDDCKNCAGKKKTRLVIKKWKEYTKKSKEKIDFGKLKGLETYKNIARESEYTNYRNYILSDECKTSESRKDKIRHFL